VLAPHYCSEDVTIDAGGGKKYRLPRGTAIFMHAWAMSQDPEFWTDPDVFKPER
jgi:cytochrome P450